jgi:hypothetical protein
MLLALVPPCAIMLGRWRRGPVEVLGRSCSCEGREGLGRRRGSRAAAAVVFFHRRRLARADSACRMPACEDDCRDIGVRDFGASDSRGRSIDSFPRATLAIFQRVSSGLGRVLLC